MKIVVRRTCILALAATACLATAGRAWSQAKVALPEAAPLNATQGTLWNLLGIPQSTQRARDAWTNRSGNNPKLERAPALKRIADPENLSAKSKVLKTAAKIKKDADAAPQKIKAIKYLATVACCCPMNKAEIAEALLISLNDCTDEVRQEAALAICKAAGNPCQTCNQCGCCTAAVMNKLDKMANQQDEQGCWLEPNEAVRQAAGQALEACRRNRQPSAPQEAVQPEGPIESRQPTEAPTPTEAPKQPVPPKPAEEAPKADTPTPAKPADPPMPAKAEPAKVSKPADAPTPFKPEPSKKPLPPKPAPGPVSATSYENVLR